MFNDKRYFLIAYHVLCMRTGKHIQYSMFTVFGKAGEYEYVFICSFGFHRISSQNPFKSSKYQIMTQLPYSTEWKNSLL